MEEQSIRENLDLREIVNLNMKWIQVFGYFCPKYNSLGKRLRQFIYAITVVIFFYILRFASQIINMVVVFGDIEQMTESSFLLLTNSVQALKGYCFIFKGDTVTSLIENLNMEEFRPQNVQQYEMLNDEIKMSKKITKTFLFMCVINCLLWAVFPFLDRQPGEPLRLPLSGWYPFRVDVSPNFEIIFVYQLVATLINGLAIISMDTFLSGMIMAISGQLSILNNSLQNMGKDYQKLEDKNEKDRTNLVRNITHYRYIIQYTNDVSSFFSTYLMAQFVASVIIICMTMFQMSLVSPVSLQFFSMSFYQVCILLEIYLWCYFGNEVILKSEKLTESAYASEWINCSKDFRKTLLFFVTRTQVPLKLYAGGYFALSLETFMAIVKMSWSYFAVLNSVHTEDRI